MAKYGPKAHEAVEREMTEFKEGKLRSGSGQKVTNPKQAIAIALSEARREGGKVPAPPSGSASAEKKTAAKKATAKKPIAKKTPAKKGADKKTAAKASATKAEPRKTAARKTPAKQS